MANIYISGVDYVGGGALGSFTSGKYQASTGHVAEFNRIFYAETNRGTYIGEKANNEGGYDLYTWGECMDTTFLDGTMAGTVRYTPKKAVSINSKVKKHINQTTNNKYTQLFLLENGELYISTLDSFLTNKESQFEKFTIKGVESYKILDIGMNTRSIIVSYLDLSDNVMKIATCGNNINGTLGIDGISSINELVHVTDVARSSLNNDMVYVFATNYTVGYALTNSTDIFVCGTNINYTLGQDLPSSQRYNIFTKIPYFDVNKLTIKSVASTVDSVCVLTTSGQVYSFGNGVWTGCNTTSAVKTPTLINRCYDADGMYNLFSSKTIIALYPSVMGMYAESSDGRIYAWGDNGSRYILGLTSVDGYRYITMPQYLGDKHIRNEFMVSNGSNIGFISHTERDGQLIIKNNGYTTLYIDLGLATYPESLSIKINDKVVFSDTMTDYPDEEYNEGMFSNYKYVIDPNTLKIGTNKLEVNATFKYSKAITRIGQIEYKGIIFDYKTQDRVLIDETVYEYDKDNCEELADHTVKLKLNKYLPASSSEYGTLRIPSIYGLFPYAKVYNSNDEGVEFIKGDIVKERIVDDNKIENKIVFDNVYGNKFKLKLICKREGGNEDNFFISAPMAAFKYYED